MLIQLDKVVNGAVINWNGRVLLVGRRSGKFVICLDGDNLPVVLPKTEMVHVERNVFFGSLDNGVSHAVCSS